MALKKGYYAATALSNTGVKKIIQSPAHFEAWKRQDHKPGKAMIIGELLHYHLLTPELMADEIAIFTKGKSLDSKKGDEFVSENFDKFVCTQDQWDFAEKVAKRVLKDKKVMALLNRPNVRNEHEIYTSVDGVKCKALLDSMCPNIILDVKSSSDTGTYFKKADGFEQKFFQLGYDIQAAWYQKMAEIADGIRRDVIFLVLELEDPFATKVVGVKQEVIDHAWEDCERAIDVYRECIENDEWPAYPFELSFVKLPAWKKKEREKRRRQEEE